MEVAQDPIEILLQNLNYLREALLSPTILRLLHTHVLSPSSTLHLLQGRLVAAMAPLAGTLLARLNALLTNSPDIVILALVVVLFLAALQLLLWLRRAVLWLTGLVVRLLFWALVAAGVALVVQRGPARTAADLAVLGAWLADWAGYFKDFWVGEYRRYDRAAGHP